MLLLWPLVAEPLLGNMPNIGTQVGPYLPFGNAFRFIDVTWLYPYYAMPWGPLGSIVYFAGVAAVAVRRGVGHRQPTGRRHVRHRLTWEQWGINRVRCPLRWRPWWWWLRSAAAATSPRRKPPTRLLRRAASGAAAEFASTLRDRIKADAMMAHLEKLQQIADAHDGNRALGTAGLRRQRRLCREHFARQGVRRTNTGVRGAPAFADEPQLTVGGATFGRQAAAVHHRHAAARVCPARWCLPASTTHPAARPPTTTACP